MVDTWWWERSAKAKETRLNMAAQCSPSTVSPSLQHKQCPMWSFECPSIALLLSHLRLVHSSDPRFLVCCGINSRTVKSRKFSSLYTHVYRHHPGAGIRHWSANSFPRNYYAQLIVDLNLMKTPFSAEQVLMQMRTTQAYNFIVYTDIQMCVFTLSILVHLQTLPQLLQTLIGSWDLMKSYRSVLLLCEF